MQGLARDCLKAGSVGFYRELGLRYNANCFKHFR